MKICTVDNARDIAFASCLLFVATDRELLCMETAPGILIPTVASLREPRLTQCLQELQIVTPADVNFAGKRLLMFSKMAYPKKKPPRLLPEHLLIKGCITLMTKFGRCTTSMAVKPMRAELETLMKVKAPERVEAKAAKSVKISDGKLIPVSGIDWGRKNWSPVAISARKRDTSTWDVFMIVEGGEKWSVVHVAINVSTGTAQAELINEKQLPHTLIFVSVDQMG